MGYTTISLNVTHTLDSPRTVIHVATDSHGLTLTQTHFNIDSQTHTGSPSHDSLLTPITTWRGWVATRYRWLGVRILVLLNRFSRHSLSPTIFPSSLETETWTFTPSETTDVDEFQHPDGEEILTMHAPSPAILLGAYDIFLDIFAKICEDSRRVLYVKMRKSRCVIV